MQGRRHKSPPELLITTVWPRVEVLVKSLKVLRVVGKHGAYFLLLVPMSVDILIALATFRKLLNAIVHKVESGLELLFFLSCEVLGMGINPVGRLSPLPKGHVALTDHVVTSWLLVLEDWGHGPISEVHGADGEGPSAGNDATILQNILLRLYPLILQSDLLICPQQLLKRA